MFAKSCTQITSEQVVQELLADPWRCVRISFRDKFSKWQAPVIGMPIVSCTTRIGGATKSRVFADTQPNDECTGETTICCIRFVRAVWREDHDRPDGQVLPGGGRFVRRPGALIRSGATIDGAVTAKPDAAVSASIAPNSPMS